MKRVFPIVAVVLTVLVAGLAAGCGKRMPDASSAEVKDLVLRIARDQYRDKLSAICYKHLSGIPTDILGMKIDYAALAEKAKTEEGAQAAMKLVDQTMEKVQLSLGNIRLDKADKETGRIHCSADVNVGDAPDPITFTAQYNDKGELYVDVFGLGNE